MSPLGSFSGMYATYTQENQIYWKTYCGTIVAKSIGKTNMSISGTNNPDTWTTGPVQ